jgi:hypothetical protein
MNKYHFYSKTDPKQEIIDQIQAPSLDIAVDYFTKRKNLTKEQFFEIYGIGIKA